MYMYVCAHMCACIRDVCHGAHEEVFVFPIHHAGPGFQIHVGCGQLYLLSHLASPVSDFFKDVSPSFCYISYLHSHTITGYSEGFFIHLGNEC